jgi:energy-coupling factor transport system ATP-binding protein
MELRVKIKTITICDTIVNYSDLSFISSTGKVVCFTGRNGAGKSLLLKALCGIIPHKNILGRIKGQIFFDDSLLDVASFERLKASFAFIADDPAANVLFSRVDEEIMIDSLVKGYDRKSAEKRAMKAMRQMRIEELANHSVHELSSGELQKVILANALTRDVSVIFLDEPTQNLDDQSKKDLFEAIKTLKKEAIILCATQDHDLVQFSDITIPISVNEADGLNDKCDCLRQIANSFLLIRKTYPTVLEMLELEVGRKGRRAFRSGPISIRLKSGQALWLKGANGRGKTTFLETLAGIRKPLSGRITLGDVSLRKQRHKITFSQHPPARTFLYPYVDGELTSLKAGDSYSMAAWRLAKDIWVGFAGDESRNNDPRSLSYGQQKMLNILCRDTCANLLLFDDPTVGLDKETCDMLVEYIRQLKKKGRIVIFSSHDESFANQVADLVLDMGTMSITSH